MNDTKQDIKTFLTSFDHIVEANPIFKDPKFYGDCEQWETVRDMVEARFPGLDTQAQGVIIGKLMNRLKR